MTRAFVAVTESAWMAERFISGLDGRQMFLSYASQFPDLSGYTNTSMWLAGGYAARLHRIGLADSLVAPGQEWLSTVDPLLTGREVTTNTLEHMPHDVKLFAKPAEAKIDSMVAGFYTRDDVEAIYANNVIPDHTLLQWTDTIMKLNHEHRFFVAHGQVFTGSPYLIDGKVYNGNMKSSRWQEAMDFAWFAIYKLAENQPDAYTLDVGYDSLSGQWVIIEANPAWSSGIYGSDPSAVLDVLDVACNGQNPRWIWKPADYLVDLARSSPAMEVCDVENASGIFMYNG